MQMEDSGKRQEFETGAVRDSSDKPRPDLISPYAQMRKGEWLRQGAAKYNERNWEKGMKFGRCIASIFRHLLQYMMGWTNEDHLAAIAVNAEFLMHYEKMIEFGQLPASLNDLPQYEKQEKFVCPTGWEIALNDGYGWYVVKTGTNQYLHKDLTIKHGTGYCGGNYGFGEVPGYWPTKEAAEDALKQYLEKTKGIYCEACFEKIRRAGNFEVVALCKECSKI